MKQRIISELNKAQQRQMGYVTIMSYAYCNLCVKADASALLGVEVPTGEMPLQIEDMADVYVQTLKEDGDDTIIDLLPKEANYLGLMAKGIFKVHPEIKQTIETYPDVREEDKDDPNAKFLRLTMPEVDKNRRDVLIQAIDALHEKCCLQLEAVKTKTKAKLVELGATPLPSSENDPKKREEDPFAKFDEQHAQYAQICENLTNDKKKEVEDAYQHYLTQQAHDGQDAEENKSSVGQQLKMD